MNRPRVVLADIAKKAGVHVTTVSLALRNSPRLPEATRTRIRALADQLDLPISALAGSDVRLSSPAAAVSLPHQPFDVEAHAYHFAGAIAAKNPEG